MSVIEFLGVRGILTIIFGAGAIFFLILGKVVRKRHLADPEFVQKEEERRAEYRRKIEEDENLEETLSSYDKETDPMLRESTAPDLSRFAEEGEDIGHN